MGVWGEEYGGESDPSGPYTYSCVIFDPCYAGQTRALHYQAFFRSSLIFRGCFTRTILSIVEVVIVGSLDTASSINYVVEKD